MEELLSLVRGVQVGAPEVRSAQAELRGPEQRVAPGAVLG